MAPHRKVLRSVSLHCLFCDDPAPRLSWSDKEDPDTLYNLVCLYPPQPQLYYYPQDPLPGHNLQTWKAHNPDY